MDSRNETSPSNNYTVQVKVNNNRYNAQLSVTPSPYEPSSPKVDTEFDPSIQVSNGLIKHTTQNVVGTKLTNSHFRPCLPNEGPLTSGCTPRKIWRPCWPPDVLTSGKQSRTLDKLGSTWVSTLTPIDHHEQKLCSFDRDWVLKAAKVPNNHRAGKKNDVQGSLLFPKAKIHIVRPILQPHGKNVGDILSRFKICRGDIYILPCVNTIYHGVLDPRGYVGFVNNSDELQCEGGLMLLRLVKHSDFKLQTPKKMKLFLLTTNLQWKLKGILDTHGYLEDLCDFQSNYKSVPVRYHRAIRPNTCDQRCIPQRGDIIIRVPWKDFFPKYHDHNASFMWWRPNLELDINDILVRACIWQCCNKFEGFVDLYYYNGKGLSWVFLGRDETIFNTKSLRREKLSPSYTSI